MNAMIEPYFDEKYERDEMIMDNLVEEVERSFSKVIHEQGMLTEIVDCFTYAWQNEDPSAIKLSERFGFSQMHLCALSRDMKELREEIMSLNY